jgi:Sporulation and spore germination
VTVATTTRWKKRLGALGALALVALAAAGCSIPTQGAPSAIPPSRVPFGLLAKHPPTTTTIPTPVYVPVKVFFFGPNNQLQPVQRNVSTPAPLTAILAALLAGPSKSEAPQLTTAIPNDVRVISASLGASVVTVNMNAAFGAITGNNALLAVAQVVYTVAAAYGSNIGVLFEIQGQHTSVPVANGSLARGPVYLLQFLGVTS